MPEVGYNQGCKHGYTVFVGTDKLTARKFPGVVDGWMVDCHNLICPEKHCKFSFFTGGQIPDSECEYYSKRER